MRLKMEFPIVFEKLFKYLIKIEMIMFESKKKYEGNLRNKITNNIQRLRVGIAGVLIRRIMYRRK